MDTGTLTALLIGVIVGLVLALYLVVLILRATGGSGHNHYH